MNYKTKEILIAIAAIIIGMVAIWLILNLAMSADGNPLECGGVERWGVKTLTDGAPVGLRAEQSTIKEQSLLARPNGDWLKLPRQKDESVLYRISGMITWAGEEADHDYHLVLSDGRRTMICEIPDPDCLPFGNSHIAVFRAARHTVDSLVGKITKTIRKVTPVSVTLTAYGFWDKPAHGTGHSANGREGHPVIWIKGN